MLFSFNLIPFYTRINVKGRTYDVLRDRKFVIECR
jgi:hypothetical protein